MPMTGAQYLASTLDRYGVSHVFHVPAILMKTFAEMEDTGIRRILGHGEKSVAYMADGYARASGRPGFCFAQNIGASNLAAGLRDAYMACAPVIAVTGGPSIESRYRNFYQEVEDLAQFDAVTKFNAEIGDISRLPDLLRQAFRSATTGTPRPVHLRVPGPWGKDFEAAEADFPVVVEARFAQAPAFRPIADPEETARAVDLLLRAERPIIVAGGGVTTSRAAPELVTLAERLAIPVAYALNAKGAIRDDHPLAVGPVGIYSRECANRAVSEADLVFFVGSHTGGQATLNWTIPAVGTAVIQLDIEPAELGRNYPNTCSLLGDAKATLQLMNEVVAESGAVRPPGAWVGRAQALVEAWRERETPLRSSTAEPMRPERICKAISDVLPADGVLVSDTGHAGMWSSTMVDFLSPDQRYIRCAGSLGWGLPGAIGAKCALPDRPVVCFAGDGAAHYHIAELETAARHGINVVLVINNNSGLNQELPLNEYAYKTRPKDRMDEVWRFNAVDFAAIAERYGCLGVTVEKPADLSGALETALRAERPSVINCVSDPTILARFAWEPGRG
jgi:acetolactate synthase-1/2/3 large subunit